MAINTEPTPRILEPGRTEGIHDSRITTRVPLRPGGPLSRESGSTERPTPRLRPVSSPSIHETVTPDRKQSPTSNAARKLAPAEFNTAMVHFYRGEVQRSNTWRSRLDNTTYWA
ncbi:MAG: DUF2270 domain-containing protein, partial [Pseudonocardiaceae bacterium]